MHPMGEARTEAFRVGFDRVIRLEFHGAKVSSDARLLVHAELDEALGLSEQVRDDGVGPRAQRREALAKSRNRRFWPPRRTGPPRWLQNADNTLVAFWRARCTMAARKASIGLADGHIGNLHSGIALLGGIGLLRRRGPR